MICDCRSRGPPRLLGKGMSLVANKSCWKHCSLTLKFYFVVVVLLQMGKKNGQGKGIWLAIVDSRETRDSVLFLSLFVI